MVIKYDIFKRTEPSQVFIAKPGKRILGQLNGIEEDSCYVEINLNNTATLSFTVDRIVNGEISNWYDYLEQHYELYVTGIGWFKINEEPEVNYDGNTETTSISAESLEIELQQYDLIGFKVNCGTVDSWEMMAVDNVYEDEDGYRLPRESVLFYRNTKEIEDLVSEFANTSGGLTDLESLAYAYPVMLDSWRITIDLNTFDSAMQSYINDMKADGQDTSVIEAMQATTNKTQDFAKSISKVYIGILQYVSLIVDTIDYDNEGGTFTISQVLDRFLLNRKQLSFMWLVLNEYGWEVGYIDDYVDTDTPKRLSDMVGKFEVDSQDVYSFLTQNAANYFRCIFVFNTNDYTVSAYKVENIGNDTNIFLNYNNVQNSITKNSDKQIYTVYHVSNNDDLKINEVNFGEDTIEDISYFLTPKHFTQEFIDKYNAWHDYRESKRPEYIQLSKDYRNQQDIATEINDRVPIDIADTDQYSSFSDDELLNERAGCEAQIAGYESLYVDENGNFDLAALQASPDWKTYKMLKDIVIPNIDIELHNRGLTSKDDYLDFKDDYLYDFGTYGDSYGLTELKIRSEELKNSMDTLAEKGYDVEGAEGDEYHAKQYALYLKYKAAYESCNEVLAQRQAEYDEAISKLNNIQSQREELVASVDKIHVSFGFTDKELAILNKYYIHTDYINENIVTTSLDDNNAIVDHEYELYKDALEQLYSDSHPQWNWSTTQDNIFLMPEFQEWHGDLYIGNFIRVSIREDYQVKLRVVTIGLNPFMVDTTLDITFSNMIQYKSKRNDAVSLLGSNGSSGKNQITSNISSSNSNTETFNIDANLVRKLISNKTFSNYMTGYGSDIVSESVSAVSGSLDYLVTQKIDAIEINVKKITGTTGEFEEVFSKYIDADYINSRVVISDVGEFKELNSYIANLKLALIGTSSTETGIVFNLTSDNAVINELLVKEQIASKISVADLKAHSATADLITLISSDGKPTIAFQNSTQQFYDSNGNVRVQIGQDGNGDFNFVIVGEDGTTALFDSTGIKKDGIPDGTIINQMIENGTIEKEKLGFEIIEPNEQGGIDITQIYDGKGGLWGVEYESFKETTESSLTTLSDNISSLSDMVQSVELTGNQVFIEDGNGYITPSSITVTATVKNGLEIGKWYLDGIENTEYVSSDKMSISIPSTYMSDKKMITIKVEGTDASKYDIFSVYKVVDGSDAYTVVISSNNGNTFKYDSGVTESIVTCTVYKGADEVTPNSYTWYYRANDGDWVELVETRKEIAFPLSTDILHKSLKCKVDI